MIITSTDAIEGKRVTKVLGLVQGSSVRAANVGKDITAVFRNLVGGELPEYTKLMSESREQALQRMTGRAEELGANAILATRMTTSTVMSGAAEVLVYGTAAAVEEE